MAEQCCRCGELTDEPVLVGVIAGNSGPDYSIYACAEHARPFQPRYSRFTEWSRRQLPAVPACLSDLRARERVGRDDEVV